MAIKQISLINHKSIVTAMLNAAGASWDSVTNSIVTIHGRDVLFDKKDPVAIEENKQMIARAVMMSADETAFAGMHAAKAVLFRGGEPAVSNYRLMKMFDSAIEAAADSALYTSEVGVSTAENTWGEFGRISILPHAEIPGRFKAFISCAQRYRRPSELIRRWNSGMREQNRIRHDMEFVTEYNKELARIEGTKSAPGKSVEVLEPTNAGIAMLIEHESHLAFENVTAHTDFLQIEFDVDTVDLIEEGKVRMSDEAIKSKKNLFGTTLETMYDAYIRAMLMEQAKAMHPMQAIVCDPENSVISMHDELGPIIRLSDGAELIDWKKPNVVQAEAFGLHLRARTVSPVAMAMENLCLLVHGTERNRQVLLVSPDSRGLAKHGIWKNAIVENPGASLMYMVNKDVMFWLVPQYFAEKESEQQLYWDKVRDAMEAMAKARNVKLRWDIQGDAYTATFTDPDENNNVLHLAHDVRDVCRVAIAAVDSVLGKTTKVPPFNIFAHQPRAFELCVQDEISRGLLPVRAILNAMRRTFCVNDIPNIPGEAGEFFRTLEAFSTVNEAVEFVKETQKQMYASYMKKVIVPTIADAMPTPPVIPGAVSYPETAPQE